MKNSSQALAAMPAASALPRPMAPRRGAAPGLKTMAQAETHAWLCFLAVAGSMFLNFVLAVANAHGIGMNNTSVTVAQIAVTALSGGLILLWPIRLTIQEQFSLGAMLLLLLMGTAINGFDAKAIYDCVFIPLYIALGRSARFVKPMWMHCLLIAVCLVVALEAVAPTAFTTLANPSRVLIATRSWVANAGLSAKMQDGLYAGAYRSGGSFFAISSHRVGGPFLEPLSLGYFGFIMAAYYGAVYNGRMIVRLGCIAVCLLLALISDSRAASALIALSAVIFLLRIRLNPLAAFVAPVIVLVGTGLYYAFSHGDDSSELVYRIGLTFDVISQTSVWNLLIGNVFSERIGDSGILYMMRAMGFLGIFVGIFHYSGIWTRRPGGNATLSGIISFYITAMLLFGGAVFSIKTASLLGFLVGVASWPADVSRYALATISRKTPKYPSVKRVYA